MDFKSYKHEVINTAIEGLVSGGLDKEFAESFRLFLERIYECGFNECRRYIEEQNCHGK